MGKYHPHGDTAIYDALVRMAQDFSLRAPLVDGHGNFGSLDGDAAAAYRYTECRAGDARRRSCSTSSARRRSTSGPTTTARASSRSSCRRAFPNLLVNGSTGIAVGMATNIPPHNLGEVIDALRRAHRRPRRSSTQGPAQARQGPGLPDRRPDAQHQEGAARDLRDRPGHAARARRVQARGAEARRPADRHHLDPVRGEQVHAGRRRSPRSSSRAQAAARCSTCATSRPRTCASCSSSRRTPTPSW